MKYQKSVKNRDIRLFKIAQLIRSSQEILMNRYHPEDLMRCPIHFCKGQEALCAALGLKFKKDDYLLSHHRSHGYYLAKNCSLDAMVAEFYGKETGSGSGLTGSQELSYHQKKFYSGTILSGMFAISLGTAYSQKLKNSNGITFTVIGDGGMEEGICSETLNLASLHKLPIIFICENNRFSVHTNIKERSIKNNFKAQVEAFNIKYFKITDYKIDKIYEKIDKIINDVRLQKKPVFLEFDTMRTCGHVGPENDDEEYGYRDKDLLKWKYKDSVYELSKKINKNLKNKIISKNIKLVNQAISKAIKSKSIKFKKSLNFNFINSYSPVVKKFSNSQNTFREGQKETKLKPY